MGREILLMIKTTLTEQGVIPPQVIGRVRIVPRPGFPRGILSHATRLFLNLFDIQRLENAQCASVRYCTIGNKPVTCRNRPGISVKLDYDRCVVGLHEKGGFC